MRKQGKRIPPVSRERLLAAIAQFDQDPAGTHAPEDWPHQRKYWYAINYENGLYPIRAIIQIAIGSQLRHFYSGNDTNSYVQERGFEVINFRTEPYRFDVLDFRTGSDPPDPILATATADITALAAEETYQEGTPSKTLINHYERDAKLRAAAVRHHGTTCQVCGFNFAVVYGPHGEGYIEVHHLKPLASYGATVTINPVTDLAVLCANCHRMIHRHPAHPLTLAELQALWQAATA